MGRLRVAAKIDAEPQATVWVAVRPEKMRITRAEPAGDQQTGAENWLAATVVDIGYLGDLSIYKLRCDSGLPIKAAIANTGRSAEARSAGTTKCGSAFPRKPQSC